MQQARGSQSAEAGSRPVAITIICVLGFIGALMSGFVIFSDVARQIAPWYPLFLGASTVIGAVCMIGLWLMRRWAVYTYTAFAAVNQGIMLAMGIWVPLALILPAIVIIVMLIYLPRMR